MILALDIGNTHIKIALFEGEVMLNYWRIATSRSYTADEYGIKLEGMFRHAERDLAQVSNVLISSVVPTVNFTIEHMCRDYIHREPLFVAPGIKTGIDIKYDNPRELGSDRICNAVAAYHYYGAPVITIDFGTATTFGVVDEGGLFLGGCIAPGIKLASEALVHGTSKLPNFELVIPERIINRTTVTNLQAGVLYGFVGQVNGLVAGIKEELARDDVKVVATGGMARLIASKAHCIDHIDGTLTLKGLRLLYEKNKDSLPA